MIQTEAYAVVLFASVSHALQAEKLLKAQGIACKLIPVPRQLSSDCGVCLRISLSVKDQVESILKGKMDFFEIASI
jgi:hypothetical protein